MGKSQNGLNRRSVGRRKLGIDLLNDRRQVRLIDVNGERKMCRRYVIAYSLNSHLHPAPTISGDGKLNKSIVAAEFGIALQAFVECGKLLSKSTKDDGFIQHRSLKWAGAYIDDRRISKLVRWPGAT